MHAMRIGHDSIPELFSIISADTVYICICHHGCRIVSDHAAAMPGACPFRKEAAFKICIDKPLLDFHALLRIDEVHKREQAPERVPESRVCRHAARTDLTIVWAVVNPLAGRIDLRKVTGEQKGTVEA